MLVQHCCYSRLNHLLDTVKVVYEFSGNITREGIVGYTGRLVHIRCIKETIMGRAIDLFVTYRFIKLLVTPFKETDAYKLGIIDEKGKRITENFINCYQ